MYSRVHTGSDSIQPYLQALLDKKINLIDYEKIRDEKDTMLIGSSKLAGIVGIFDMFRILGEYLLLRKIINTPFLYSGGSAYMHPNLESCQKSLQNISQMIQDEGGLPKSITPFVIGIAGRGIVG